MASRGSIMAQNTVLHYAVRQVRGPGDHDPGYGKPRRVRAMVMTDRRSLAGSLTG